MAHADIIKNENIDVCDPIYGGLLLVGISHPHLTGKLHRRRDHHGAALFEGMSSRRISQMRFPDTAWTPEIQVLACTVKIPTGFKSESVFGPDAKALKSENLVGFLASEQPDQFAAELKRATFLFPAGFPPSATGRTAAFYQRASPNPGTRQGPAGQKDRRNPFPGLLALAIQATINS